MSGAYFSQDPENELVGNVGLTSQSELEQLGYNSKGTRLLLKMLKV